MKQIPFTRPVKTSVFFCRDFNNEALLLWGRKKLNFLDATIIGPDFKDLNIIPSSKDIENKPLKKVKEPKEKRLSQRPINPRNLK